MSKYQLYYDDVCIGHIVQNSNTGNVIHGSIEYEQLDESLPIHSHIKDFISNVIEMTSSASKRIKEKQPRDESESAKEEFNQKWAPYQDLTNKLHWHVLNSEGLKLSISTPMFEEGNQVACCILKAEITNN